MRLYYLTMLITVFSISLFLLANSAISGNATQHVQQSLRKDFASKTFVVINTDGDLSLNPEQNMNLWNPHAVGLTSASNVRFTFVNETEMWLETSASETGHIATGAWWTTSFLTRQRFPIYASEPVRIAASFRIKIPDVDLGSGNEWLRIALACAVQRSDESVVYTEMDLWDSPTALAHPSGNIRLGGDVVYNGGDVVEYKIDQVTIGQWKSFTLDLTHAINDAWQLKPGDLLESVYFVVEAAGAVNVTVKADDLLIIRSD